MGWIKCFIDFNKLSKKKRKDSIDYVLTYTYNCKLSRMYSIPINCKDNKR